MIIPPEGSYFIHGFSSWSKNHLIDFPHSEISVSIQKDDHTVPLRPIGFILEIQDGGIIAAFDRDVCSKIVRDRKVYSPWSSRSKNYTDLNELLANTPKGKHNELWVRSSFATIIAGYVVTGTKAKFFQKQMRKANYPIRII